VPWCYFEADVDLRRLRHGWRCCDSLWGRTEFLRRLKRGPIFSGLAARVEFVPFPNLFQAEFFSQPPNKVGGLVRGYAKSFEVQTKYSRSFASLRMTILGGI
jgi:hypothetical protein